MLKNIKIKKYLITFCVILYTINSIAHDFYSKTNVNNYVVSDANCVDYFLNSVTATNACKRDNTSNVTLNSSAEGLPTGDYLVTYSLSYNGNSTSLTAPMTVLNAGTGSFVADVSIVNTNSSTTIKINSIKSLATAVVSNLSSNNISNVSKMLSVTNKPNITNIYATCANYIIQWNNDSVDEYFLDVATDANFSTFLSGYQNKALGNVFSHEILGMIQGQTYYCRIRTKNYCGISINSDIKSFTKNGYGWINPIQGGTDPIVIGVAAFDFSNATSGGTWSIINGTGTARIEPRGSSNNLAVVIGTTPGTATVVYTVNNGCNTSVTKSIIITNKTQTTPSVFINSTTATDACKRDNTSNVTLNSSAEGLPTGDYLVTYSLSYNGNSTSLTAPMTVSTAGTGSFTADLSIVNTNSSTTIKINSLKSLATDVVSNLTSNNISNVSKMVLGVTNSPNITNIYATCANYIIQWNNDGADEYFLDVATDTNFNTFLPGYQNKAMGNVFSHEILGMIQGQTYYCRIRSKNYCGTSIDNDVDIKSFTKIGYGWINPIQGGTDSIAIGASAAFSNATSGGTWSIINGTGTATIDSNGIVTGVSLGSSTIVYTVNNGCYTSVTKSIIITENPSFFINSTTATDACKRDNTSNVTLNSSAEGLPTGDYLVTYSLSYNGNSTSLTAPMTVLNAGTGSFVADVSIVNTNSSTTIKINSIKSLATAVVSNLSSNNISNVSKMLSVTNKPNITNIYATCTNYIIQWNNDSVDEYFLDVATDANFSTFLPGYQNKALGNAISHEILGMSQGQTYYCRIRSKNYCGISIDSDIKSFTKVGYGWINPIQGGTDSITIGASAAFSNATSGGTWSILDGTGTATIDSNGIVTGVSLGSSTIVYTVNNGCYTSVTKSIIITENPSFFINSTTATDACKRDNTSNVTLNSSADGLPTGDYLVTYSLSYNGNSTLPTAPMTVLTAGTGSFTADLSIVNTNLSTTIKIISIRSLATGVLTRLSSNNISNVSKMISVANKPNITNIYATCTNYIIQWNNDSVDEYFLDVATDANFSTFLPGYENKALGNAISHEILGMSQGQTYYCRIRSKNYCGISIDSDVKSFTKIGNGEISPILGGTDPIGIGVSTPAFTNAISGGTWSIINGTGTATIDGSGIVTGVSLGSSTIVYTVNNGCPSSAILPIIITINNTIILTSEIATANQTICKNKNITNITYSTSGATGATVTGLPPGVTGNWVSQTFTITGVPTSAGNFPYAITLIGANNSQVTTGTITVLENPTIQINSALGTDNQTKTINEPITPISYITSGAVKATFSGLPPGIIGNFTNNIITITGSPTTSGEFIYSILLSGNCDTSITGKINALCEPIIGDIKIITLTSTLYNFSSPGKTASALACQEAAFPLKFYAATSTLNVNSKLYSNEELTTPVNGQKLWYQNKTNSIAYKVDNTGEIIETYSCGVPSTSCDKRFLDHVTVVGQSGTITLNYFLPDGTEVNKAITHAEHGGEQIFTFSIDTCISPESVTIDGLTISQDIVWNDNHDCCPIIPRSYEFQFSNPGRTSTSLACSQTSFTNKFYAATSILGIGTQMYLNADLTTPVVSGDLWYQLGIDGVSYRIDYVGRITETYSCSTPPVSSSNAFQFSYSDTTAALACSQVTFPLTLYSQSSSLNIGDQIYSDINLTTNVVGDNLWYQLNTNGISYQIDNTGKIAAAFSCIESPCTANVTASQYSKTIASLEGTAITLSSTTPGTTFSWTVIQSGVIGATAGNGNFINQILTNLGATTGTATYTITPTLNNCSGTPIVVVITVKPTVPVFILEWDHMVSLGQNNSGEPSPYTDESVFAIIINGEKVVYSNIGLEGGERNGTISVEPGVAVNITGYANGVPNWNNSGFTHNYFKISVLDHNGNEIGTHTEENMGGSMQVHDVQFIMPSGGVRVKGTNF
ncbi:beta strand repeat-containing protein [Flavobacterium marginilacus]|uniref:beta strand repeat-containing protein n=1 Tax=Flavobacterium marginilacus TaxID=3003256 RepID=UPI00248E494F|nr:hypothetical protein [Flavobacterium marginilacus]